MLLKNQKSIYEWKKNSKADAFTICNQNALKEYIKHLIMGG